MKAKLQLALFLGALSLPLFATERLPADGADSTRLKGEFVLSSRHSNRAAICQRFTQNLNQFRPLDFKTCHPRLSEKFPEFSRPQWRELPFDLKLAEQLFKSAYHSSQAANAERLWQQWLKTAKSSIRQEHIRMWLTRIDLDGDGIQEDIIRLMPTFALLETIGPEPQWSCDYIYSSFYITDTNHAKVTGKFDSYGDIIYSQVDRRYYQVIWVAHGPLSPDTYVAEAASVVLANLNWNGVTVTNNAACVIDWMPIDHKRRP